MISKAEIRTEAMRQAKADIKHQIKAGGGKLRYFAAGEIDKAAKALIAKDPSYIRNAERSLQRRIERTAQ